MNHTALATCTISNSIKLRDVMQGTTYKFHSTFGWSVGETVRCSISKIDRCSIPNIDRCLIPKIDQCAVAEVNDRLIAEWDRSQNRTAAPLLEHGIGPSLYCSIKKTLVVQCLVARPPGPPYLVLSVVEPLKVAERYYWKGMASDIANYCSTCLVCQRQNKMPKKLQNCILFRHCPTC